MQHAQRKLRERHQRPPCDECSGVGMVEGAGGAVPCEECA